MHSGMAGYTSQNYQHRLFRSHMTAVMMNMMNNRLQMSSELHQFMWSFYGSIVYLNPCFHTFVFEVQIQLETKIMSKNLTEADKEEICRRIQSSV